jgi:hypothetical protein
MHLSRVLHWCFSCSRSWWCGVCPTDIPCQAPCPWCAEEPAAPSEEEDNSIIEDRIPQPPAAVRVPRVARVPQEAPPGEEGR